MNAATRSIIGYQVSDNRGVGPCILAMRMAFRGLTLQHFHLVKDFVVIVFMWAQKVVVSDPECQVIVGPVDVVKAVCMTVRQQTILNMQKNGTATPERSCCQ